jgi:hypothetical protein
MGNGNRRLRIYNFWEPELCEINKDKKYAEEKKYLTNSPNYVILILDVTG